MRLFVLMTVFILGPLLGSKHCVSKLNLITVQSVFSLSDNHFGNGFHVNMILLYNKAADNTKHMVVLNSYLIQFSYVKCIQ